MPTITVNKTELYYECTGSGPLLTLIMGLSCSTRRWYSILPILNRHFTVITFDNRGCGRSAKPDMDYSTELFADDTAALLRALGIPRSHIFGISMGGQIAQRFALKYPAMVDRLILGCTLPNATHLPPSPEVVENLQISQTLPPMECASRVAAIFLSKRFVFDHPDKYELLREHMLHDKTDQGQTAFYNQLSAVMEHDSLNELNQISAPTLVITGDMDPVAPPANAHCLAEHIPSCKLVVLHRAAHMFFIEEPERTCEIIADFLSMEKQAHT